MCGPYPTYQVSNVCPKKPKTFQRQQTFNLRIGAGTKSFVNLGGISDAHEHHQSILFREQVL